MQMSSMSPMPMPTSGAHSSSGDMAGMGRMSMNSMAMTFFTSITTPLFSSDWAPQTTGQYAGTCIFLIFLASMLRVLYAYKSILESKWLHKARERRYIQIAPEASTKEIKAPSEDTHKTTSKATLTTNGVSKTVKLVESDITVPRSDWSAPWRLSVDLPRALLVTVMLGFGYLLMLAVMTMNVGYFISVLSGAFLGELFAGRYSRHQEA